MSKYKTTMNRKPATVEVADDGSLTVTSQKRTWGFNANLQPASLEVFGLHKVDFTLHDDRLLMFTHEEGGGVGSHSLDKKDENAQTYIASFGQALDAISDISERTPLPPKVKNKLADAYTFLGITGPALT